jgi:hypothetical protein
MLVKALTLFLRHLTGQMADLTYREVRSEELPSLIATKSTCLRVLYRLNDSTTSGARRDEAV